MGILDRYHLRLKRPTADDDWASLRENLRAIERWANNLPIPAPFTYPIDSPAGLTTSFALLQSFPFQTALPNTVVVIDLNATIDVLSTGGGHVDLFCAVDGTQIDPFDFGKFDEASKHGNCNTGNSLLVNPPGNHTVEVWGKKSIAAGSFAIGGTIRISIY